MDSLGINFPHLIYLIDYPIPILNCNLKFWYISLILFFLIILLCVSYIYKALIYNAKKELGVVNPV